MGPFTPSTASFLSCPFVTTISPCHRPTLPPMASHADCLPLVPESVKAAHDKIKRYIHRTPLLTNRTLDRIVSSPDPDAAAAAASTSSQPGGASPAPKLRLYMKCENHQKIGAFKARGAFHALLHLIEVMGIDKVRERGVVTHSSGNHAQALALAAHTFEVPAYIVMPSISTPSKIAGTQAYTDKVIFSGSTSKEREAVVQGVVEKSGAILVPPYDHPDIVLGQGTTAFELHQQFEELKAAEGTSEPPDTSLGSANGSSATPPHLHAVLVPTGGGGLLSGVVTYFGDKPETYVFGAEPSFQGGDNAKRGLEALPVPKRITTVSTLTIADGLRTPLGEVPWRVLTSGSASKPKFLQGMQSVSEDEIKRALRLVYERVKVVVEPSAVVGLAALLYDRDLREWIHARQQEEGGTGEPWNVGVIFTGGNTTMDALAGLFAPRAAAVAEEEGLASEPAKKLEREEGLIGMDGDRVAENVAG